MTNETNNRGIDVSLTDEGRTLPPSAFFSPDVYAAEMDTVFASSWVHVADLEDVTKPGDFVAVDIGTTPVVVVRGKDGELRGFLNACRHRFATIAEGRGNCGSQLKCPYHGWSYTTDGSLVGIPRREEFKSCDASALGLVPIRIATCGPLVFGCLSADAPPFSDWAGYLPEALAAAGAGSMQRSFELTYEIDVNWKIYVENGLEGYHLDFVHDVLTSFVDGERVDHHFTDYTSHTVVKISEQFMAMMPPDSDRSAGDAVVRFGFVYPNLVPVITPGDFSYLRIDPIGPERIRLRGVGFDPGGDFANLRDFRREAFNRTNEQDIGVVTRVQRGLHARNIPRGTYSTGIEQRIGHFERLISEALTP
jgi:phenylpropionate dioxygenase-like ring-hydroxylating dioxygenase large terminal subunit